MYLKFLHILIAAMICNQAFSQAGTLINAYEYWLDDDYLNSQLIDISPVAEFQLNDELTLPPLGNGIHKLSIRFRDDAGYWSGAMERSFTVFPTPNASNTVVSGEYWLDGDFSQAQELSFDPAADIELHNDLSIGSLNPGFHTIGFHFMDSDGQLTPPFVKTIFIDGASEIGAELIAYRYWYNDDLENIRNASVSEAPDPYEWVGEIETNAVGFGPGQKFSLQFQNDAFLWSNVFEAEFEKILGCAPDFNGDNLINTADLTFILGSFGCTMDCGPGDLNMDGTVNSGDLVTLLGVFGTNCME